MNIVNILLLVSVVSAVVVSQRVTYTVTTSIIVRSTTTTTLSTHTGCVIYTNVPIVCRRRKQLWFNHPIILAEDDDVGQSQFIQPEPVQRVEITAVPDIYRVDHYNIPYSRYMQPTNLYFYPVSAHWAMQPSLVDRGFLGSYATNQVEPRFKKKDPVKLAQIYDFFGRLLNIAELVTQTVRGTIVSTVTANVFTTTNTAIVSGCRPSKITLKPC